MCIECNHVVRSKSLHVHTYEKIEYNRREHWGFCACGERIENEAHRFSMETGRCVICDAESSPLGAEKNYDIVIMYTIGVAGIAIAVMTLILIIRRLFRKRI